MTKLATEGRAIRCKAAVARKAGEPLVIEEVIVDPPKADEVRIKIICTSLCHTDVTFWKLNEPPSCFPMIMGHEAVGTVESVGENVTEVVPGDYVIPTFLADCGECPDCKSTKSNLCSTQPFEIAPYMPRDKTTRFKDSKGETIYHFVNISSFSEYTVIDVAHIAKVDPAIPPNRACLIGCGISTGVGASWRAAGVEPGSTVAVFGLGVIGLAAVEGARLCGAKQIIGVDLNPAKQKIGEQFGMTDFINPKECKDRSVSQAIKCIRKGSYPPRIKIFTWKLLYGIIPYGALLAHRCGDAFLEKCTLCGGYDKLTHVLSIVLRPSGGGVYITFNIPSRSPMMQVFYWFTYVCLDKTTKDNEQVVTLIWKLWFAKCQVVHNRARSYEQGIDQVESFLDTALVANSSQSNLSMDGGDHSSADLQVSVDRSVDNEFLGVGDYL